MTQRKSSKVQAKKTVGTITVKITDKDLEKRVKAVLEVSGYTGEAFAKLAIRNMVNEMESFRKKQTAVEQDTPAGKIAIKLAEEKEPININFVHQEWLDRYKAIIAVLEKQGAGEREFIKTAICMMIGEFEKLSAGAGINIDSARVGIWEQNKNITIIDQALSFLHAQRGTKREEEGYYDHR